MSDCCILAVRGVDPATGSRYPSPAGEPDGVDVTEASV